MSYNRQPLLEEGVSHVTATNSVDTGTRQWVAGNQYIYVENGSASDAYPGYGMVLEAGASAYSCTISSTTSADLLMGVVKHATIPAGSYGWIVAEGFVNVEAGATLDTSENIVLGANGAFHPASNATGLLANCVGKALDTIATDASGSAYIKAC